MSPLLDKFAALATAAMPPVDDSQIAVRRWRLMMWLWQMAISSALTLHVLWACNWLPGVQGFAMAADLARQQDTTARIEIMNLRQLMTDLQIKRCQAAEAHKPTRWLTEQLNHAQYDHRAVTGEYWLVPSCQDLGE